MGNDHTNPKKILKFTYYDTLMYYFEKKSDDPYKLKRYEEAIQSYDKFQSYDKTS